MMNKIFSENNDDKCCFSSEFIDDLSEIHSITKNIICDYNRKRIDSKIWTSLKSLFFPEIWTTIFSFILFLLLTLSIFSRFFCGPILVKGEINNLNLLIIFLFYILINFCWLFRYLIYDQIRYKTKKQEVGLDSSTRIFRSLTYQNYSLREKDILDARIDIREKRKILYGLSLLNLDSLKFAEQHYSYLESVSKKEENLAITFIVLSFGVLSNIIYSFLLFRIKNDPISWLDQGQFLVVFSTLCVTYIKRTFQLDSLATRFGICINLLRQAQILNQTLLDDDVSARPRQLDLKDAVNPVLRVGLDQLTHDSSKVDQAYKIQAVELEPIVQNVDNIAEILDLIEE